ncbi:MAG: PASTA domain-containing protein, partial [Ktedonobacterales bacterium]
MQLGLKIGTPVLQPDPSVLSGEVIKTTPPAGTSVAPGTTVILYVSSGPPQPTPTVTPPVQPTATPNPAITPTATP